MLFPRSLMKIFFDGRFDREVATYVARRRATRVRGSNPVSGGQCHLIVFSLYVTQNGPSIIYLCLCSDIMGIISV